MANKRTKSSKGFIYILVHPTMNGYVKIGKTQRTAETRANELTTNAGSGMVGSFVVAYEIEVVDYDLIEILVHQKLDKFRVLTNREFFYISVKDAIICINKVILEKEQQKVLDFDINNPEIWFNNQNIIWKQIFRKYLELNFQPSQNELIDAIQNIIFYSRDENLRNKIGELVKKKDFQEKIETWFAKLETPQQNEVKSFISRAFSNEDTEKLQLIEYFDCNGNLHIDTLQPINPMNVIKKLNCSNSNITNLEPISDKLTMEELDISYTAITSLKELEKLINLKLIKAYHSDISEEEIERFQKINPNCKISKNKTNRLLE